MTIISAPSPNFNERKLPLSILVLHYTGMESGQAAIDRLRDPKAEVSAHYVVEEDGRVFGLVDENKRAWHAGRGEWAGVTDVNSASIGIEIVNGGHDYGLPDFPDVQIDSVIALCSAIVDRHAIKPVNVIGHSDLAPGRKTDPGEKFPWAKLAQAGLGLWPDPQAPDRRNLFASGDRDRGVAAAQRGLAMIGYGVSVTGVFDDMTVDCVTAFQRRFRPDHIDGQIDVETVSLISAINSKL